MLEIGIIRDQKERIIDGLKKRNVNDELLSLIDEAILADDHRKAVQTQLDQLLAQSNQLAKEIGQYFKSGEQDKANQLKEQVSELKEEIKSLETTLKSTKERLEDLIIQLPNVPHSSVPFGTKAEDNEVYLGWDKPMPTLWSGALPHWELAEKYDIISFKDGV
ncbi:MAG: DUF2203 family protein, partial [Chitinophagales bacterium]|nr:DUF2203 family protein [Chitinophagales bacterium]